MDKVFIFRRLLYLCVAMLCISCSPLIYEQASYESDDLYNTHNQDDIINEKVARAKAEEEAEIRRREQWAALLNAAGGNASTVVEVVDPSIFNTPYGARLAALSASSYIKPASYYQYVSEETLETLADYDPSEYTAYIGTDGSISVQPKYMSSMYGMWTPYHDRYAWYYGYPHHPRWGWRNNYYRWNRYPYYGWDYGYNYGWDYGWNYGWNYGYDGWYGYYPPRPPFYVGGVRRGYKSAIVTHANMINQGIAAQTYIGKRQQSGATVGRTTSPSSTYNRGTTTSPTYSRPTTSTPVSERKTNSLGR